MAGAWRRAAAALIALVAAAVEVPDAPAHGPRTPVGAMAAVGDPCPGDAIAPDEVITGSFPASMQGDYVLLPFTVPDGTTAVRTKYCHDQPDLPTGGQVKHVLDLGLYGPRSGGDLWGVAEFRGWGGSSHPDVTVSAEGFDSAQPTTRAFRPGPVTDGRWAVELGLGAVAGRELGDSDGAVEWRVEIDLIGDPAYADEPYAPAPYDARPVRAQPGWYAGDLHVHGEHSALGDAKMTEVFEYAFSDAGAKLDFITLSDYVGGASWPEIGRFGVGEHLVVRSAEVITYRGHVNAHASPRVVDYRTGDVFERRPDGTLELRRAARPASELLAEIRAHGGVTQLNHVTIFPNEVPLFALLCRGCPWDYSIAETDYRLVDAIEVATGPGGLQDVPGGLGPNPFTVTAVDFYERALATGNRIAAVGSSDSHNAGRRSNPVTQSPIGQATTMLYAAELSEAGVACAIRAGHTYVKVWGADRPDMRLEARATGLGERFAIFGDTLVADAATFTARVLGAVPLEGQPFQLLVVKDGAVISSHALSAAEETVEFAASGPGRYGLRLMRGSSIEAVSTPIWLESAGGAAPRLVTRDCTPAPAAAARTRARRAHARQRRAAARRRAAHVRRARATARRRSLR